MLLFSYSSCFSLGYRLGCGKVLLIFKGGFPEGRIEMGRYLEFVGYTSANPKVVGAWSL